MSVWKDQESRFIVNIFVKPFPLQSITRARFFLFNKLTFEFPHKHVPLSLHCIGSKYLLVVNIAYAEFYLSRLSLGSHKDIVYSID